MNGKDNKYLIDLNIFIYHLNGDNNITQFLLQNKDISAISRITFIEVLSFNFNIEEETLAKEYLNNFTIIDTDEQIALQVIKNRKLKKIKVPDNIIVATAQINNLTLVTRNIEDFNSVNVKLLNPFDKN